VNIECRKRRKLAGHGVLKVKDIFSLIKSYDARAVQDGWHDHSEQKVRLPTAGTSVTDKPINGVGIVPISVWIRNAGIRFPIISLSIALRELQALFEVRAVIICEEDEWCRSLLQLVAPVAFPSAASIRFFSSLSALRQANLSLQQEFPFKRYMTDCCNTSDCVFSSKEGRGAGLHGDRSNPFFEDRRFLVESCNMVGVHGYATFSQFCPFHDRGLQDTEEMVACKGPFFQTCPSTQGGQRRPTNIFLYPGVHAGPIHAPEEFNVPKGWEWPANEAKEHLVSGGSHSG
jgi:hypothetical protein